MGGHALTMARIWPVSSLTGLHQCMHTHELTFTKHRQPMFNYYITLCMTWPIIPNMEYESDMWHLWNVHVAPANRTAGCLFPCMLDLDRDIHFNTYYGGIGLLNGRWQHCITTVNISLYTWVYKCHIHECIWQNIREWPKWAEVWLYTECYMEIYKWIDIVGNLARNITKHNGHNTIDIIHWT